MSRWHHAPCPKCGSSDAFSYKDNDEWGYCFSCNKNSPINGDVVPTTYTEYNDMHTLDNIATYDTRGFQERAIKKTISEHFGVKVSYGTDGSIESHFYPYTRDNIICAYKERQLPKKFVIHGDFKGAQLFGQNVAGGGRRVVITEGELDALAVAQANQDKYGKFYPVVAIPSASQTKLLLEQREWLRGFDEVILMFDMDEPGQKAVAEAAKIIGFDKVKVAKLPEKDPCDVLIKHGSDALVNCIFNAKTFSPAGIVKGEEVWDQFKQKQSIVSLPYPPCLEGLNEKIKGLRMGEMVLLTSGTGSGKSTIVKEVVLNVLEQTTDSVGMVSLEESVGDTAEKFIGMAISKNLSDDTEVSEEELRAGYNKVFADERLILLDHQGSVSDESLTDKIEHLCLLGCKYIILDHITIAVSEGAKGKTGNEAIDSVMSDLLKIVKKHNIWMGVISHLRKSDKKPFEEGELPSMDDIKGSGSIKQISFDIIAFARNMVAENETERNLIKLRVLKSRTVGRTGDAGTCSYNPKTGRLTKGPTMLDFN
jgi:twinkle protein